MSFPPGLRWERETGQWPLHHWPGLTSVKCMLHAPIKTKFRCLHFPNIAKAPLIHRRHKCSVADPLAGVHKSPKLPHVGWFLCRSADPMIEVCKGLWYERLNMVRLIYSPELLNSLDPDFWLWRSHTQLSHSPSHPLIMLRDDWINCRDQSSIGESSTDLRPKRWFFVLPSNQMITSTNWSWKSLIDRLTLPETNVSPAKWWLGDYVPFANAYFQGIC